MGAPHQPAGAGRAEPAPASTPPLGIAYFTGAYPGQAVVKGRPNRLRRAAHYARAAYIASQSGNATLAEAWTAALNRLPLDLDELRADCEGRD
ncbi:hypothetical protein J2X16_000789 [Pelomonas aquatica]|uniref:Uncharacterized protein n=1 Tax=Pelomonas aquatica TaxID=431058 RepID=A0ABU1Z4D5_9BURK|nr:hypothetical protein [Pelomonas aquatica]